MLETLKPKPTRVVLIRHGQTSHNSEGRFQGRLDVPLDEEGMKQASTCAKALKAGAYGMPIDAIYTSTLMRASATARIIAEAIGLTETGLDELREIDCGEVSNLTVTEARKKFPEVMDRFSENWWLMRYPKGQSHSSYETENVIPALRRIVAEQPGKTVLAVTHGGFIRTAVLYFIGIGDVKPFLNYRLDNCGLTTIELHDEGGRLIGKVKEFNLGFSDEGNAALDVYSKEGELR